MVQGTSALGQGGHGNGQMHPHRVSQGSPVSEDPDALATASCIPGYLLQPESQRPIPEPEDPSDADGHRTGWTLSLSALCVTALWSDGAAALCG